MSHHSKSGHHQSDEHRRIAQTYGARIVLGKLVLILVGCASLAVIFLLGTVRSSAAIGALALGAACFISVFIGDFPAWVRCPACGKRMKARTHQDPHPYKRYRYLACPKCQQTVALSSDDTFSSLP
jgi:hypothetical protein